MHTGLDPPALEGIHIRINRHIKPKHRKYGSVPHLRMICVVVSRRKNDRPLRPFAHIQNPITHNFREVDICYVLAILRHNCIIIYIYIYSIYIYACNNTKCIVIFIYIRILIIHTTQILKSETLEAPGTPTDHPSQHSLKLLPKVS
jgi:hypothetical protein